MVASRQWEVEPEWYADWSARRKAHWASKPVPDGPFFSLVMPCFNTPRSILRQTLVSVLEQSYPNWELCIADDGSDDDSVSSTVADLQRQDPRISFKRLPENGGIAAASNAALAMAKGDFVVPIDHDDLLPKHALAAVAEYLASHSRARFVYSDSDRIDQTGRRCRPFFKPGWDYDRFLAQNYLNHLTAIETSLVRSLGGWRTGFEGSQDYDLYLRVVENLGRTEILHIPEVLYHWREIDSSFSRSRLAAAVKAARHAIEEHLERTQRSCRVSAPPGALIYNRIHWPLPDTPTRVALVMLGSGYMEAGARLRATFASDSEHSKLQVDLIPCEESTWQFLAIDRVVQDQSVDVVALLDARLSSLSCETLSEMVACCLREEVGCVGPKCFDENGVLLGSPTVLNIAEMDRGRFDAMFPEANLQDRGYTSHLLLDQETDVLSPHAVVFRREHLTVYSSLCRRYADSRMSLADFCLETARRGFKTMWLGSTSLAFELKADKEVAFPDEDRHRFTARWKPSSTMRSPIYGVEWASSARD